MGVSRAFRALGHPHRLAVVRRLMREAFACCEGEAAEACSFEVGSCNVGALAEVVGCAPSTLSHHLKILEEAGIIERSRRGRELLCRLNQERLTELSRCLSPAPATA